MSGPPRTLTDWEVAELRRRANSIMAEHPRCKGFRRHDGRYSRLCFLADDYRITIRTLYRYIERAA